MNERLLLHIAANLRGFAQDIEELASTPSKASTMTLSLDDILKGPGYVYGCIKQYLGQLPRTEHEAIGLQVIDAYAALSKDSPADKQKGESK